jgi:hypothetical protein
MAHVLTVTINAAGDIEIRDAAGNEGGDLKVTSGDDVTWVNATTAKCKLSFKRLKLGGSPSYGPPAWPFTEAQQGNEKDIPQPPPGQTTKWTGKIDKKKVSSEAQAIYVKYDVHVAGHGKPLDPIIIIEK